MSTHTPFSEDAVTDSPTTHPRKGTGNREGKRKGEQVIHEPNLPRATTDPVDNLAAATAADMVAGHDQPLFGGYTPPERDQLSPGQRLTQRQAANVRAGVHPLTGGRLHVNAHRDRDASSPQDGTPTCGNCQFRGLYGHHDQSHPKCYFGDGVRITHGPATDVRAWWPGCSSWTPKGRA